MAGLEALDRRIHIGIEGRRDACARRQVARNHQALAQWHDVAIDDAELQLLAGRHHRPAACRDDVLILRDRCLGKPTVCGLKIGRVEATLPPPRRWRRTDRPNCRGAKIEGRPRSHPEHWRGLLLWWPRARRLPIERTAAGGHRRSSHCFATIQTSGIMPTRTRATLGSATLTIGQPWPGSTTAESCDSRDPVPACTMELRRCITRVPRFTGIMAATWP